MWRANRKNKRRWAENESRWEVLRSRVSGLELAVKQLVDRSSKEPSVAEAAAPSTAAEPHVAPSPAVPPPVSAVEVTPAE